jgi:hypothetical protein
MPLQKPNLSSNARLRYDLGVITPFITDNNAFMFDSLSSEFLQLIRDLPVYGTFRIVTEIFRIDLISYRIYDSVVYKIPLMIYNDIIHPYECYHGRVLKYPSLIDLDALLYAS